MDAGSTPQLRFPDVPKLELDDLLDQLVERAEGVKRVQGRLRGLLRAVETVAGDLSLDDILLRLVTSACELANAEYGALGVIGPDGGLEQFVHVGMPRDAVERIGHLPDGLGLLGALITDPRPIRLAHMRDDPRSVGFPAGHPPMDSFLGVPVTVRGAVFGNLYLSNSAHGEFSEEDQELMTALSVAAAGAISNARLYQESRMQQRWLQASAEVGAQLFAETGEDPLVAVGRRAVDLAGADLVSIGLVADDREHLVIEAAFGADAADLVGVRIRLADSFAGRVVESGAPLVLAAAGDDPERLGVVEQVLDAGPVLVLPLRGPGDVRGVLSLVRLRGRRAFTPAEVAMASGFAAHASVAIELAEARAAERKVVVLEERDRIARDLHDHVIQELYAVGMSFQGVATQLGTDTPLGRRTLERVEDIDRTIRRIRTSIFELRGNFAASPEGLRHEVLRVASELTPLLGYTPHIAFSGLVDVVVDASLTDDVVACVREALTNVAKHARATSIAVDLLTANDELVLTVTDNGVGMSAADRSSGIANLKARAERRGGQFAIGPGSTGGTTLQWKVPTP